MYIYLVGLEALFWFKYLSLILCVCADLQACLSLDCSLMQQVVPKFHVWAQLYLVYLFYSSTETSSSSGSSGMSDSRRSGMLNIYASGKVPTRRHADLHQQKQKDKSNQSSPSRYEKFTCHVTSASFNLFPASHDFCCSLL